MSVFSGCIALSLIIRFNELKFSRILVSKRFFTLFFTSRRFNAIALYPFVILKNEQLANNKELLLHERIHLRQQIELLIFPFYILYLSEFIVRFLFTFNAAWAYRNLSFEREAYRNMNNHDYFKDRKFWAWLRYF
jgi:hypothetical protein